MRKRLRRIEERVIRNIITIISIPNIVTITVIVIVIVVAIIITITGTTRRSSASVRYTWQSCAGERVEASERDAHGMLKGLVKGCPRHALGMLKGCALDAEGLGLGCQRDAGEALTRGCHQYWQKTKLQAAAGKRSSSSSPHRSHVSTPQCLPGGKKKCPRTKKVVPPGGPRSAPTHLENFRVGLESGSGKWTPFFPPLRALELLGHSPRGLARGGFVGAQRPDEQRLACPRGFKAPSWRPSELKRARGGPTKLI